MLAHYHMEDREGIDNIMKRCLKSLLIRTNIIIERYLFSVCLQFSCKMYSHTRGLNYIIIHFVYKKL